MRPAILLAVILSVCCAGPLHSLPAEAAESPHSGPSIEEMLAGMKPDNSVIMDGPVSAPRIVLDKEIDESSVDSTIAHIHEAEKAGAKVIIIEMNTPGGSVDDGFRLAKVIEDTPTPVYCVVDGMAASMGFYLLQSCDQRIMTSRSTLMAHEISVALPGGAPTNEQKLRGVVEYLHAASIALDHHDCHRLTIPFEQCYAHVHGQDWWLTSDDAPIVGAVDLVVPSVNGWLVDVRASL